MANTFLLAAESLGDNVVEGLIVTVTGVVLVFLILAFLILVCSILMHFNALMNIWDSYMARVRLRRGEIKKIKAGFKQDMNDSVQALGDLSDDERKTKIAELKAEYKTKLAEAKAAVNAEFARVSALEKEMRAEIKSVKAEYKAKLVNEAAAAKTAGSDVKAVKILIGEERRAAIKRVADDYKAKISALSDDGVDDEAIAVITAVVTAMTAEDAKSRNVRYTIKSIKKL